ncbi:MAG TPA: amino acid racemase [Candidatus Eisenbacteria bacterium]|uniref:Amino acid racemase n=1 Tax=Eiseniibacteriota bacterium TaxID=2212470 RepID=A0A7V2F405_UNCEI|nr:amino acid racemase [Candidatus Eisenbacteria bacterium]
MKKIGIIGGLGPEPTIEYYKIITGHCRRERKRCPRIVIYSMDVDELRDLFDADRRKDIVETLFEGIRAINGAGADFGLIAANTPHIVFGELAEISPIPLLSIVEETLRAIEEKGLRRVGLLGTSFTMRSDLFQRELQPAGIEVFVPNEGEQEYIQRKIYQELTAGDFRGETREGLLDIVGNLIERHSIEGLILGCTELPLILDRDELGIPFLDTARIHAEAAIARCMEE